MPLPIPILGVTQVDPTLQEFIKPPLYAVDEYQLYDLMLWDAGAIYRKDYFKAEISQYLFSQEVPGWDINFSGSNLPYYFISGIEFFFSRFKTIPYGNYNDEAALASQTITLNGVTGRFTYPKQRRFYPGTTTPIDGQTNYEILESGSFLLKDCDWNKKLYNNKITSSDDPDLNQSHYRIMIGNSAALIQRFSVWSYPWAEDYIKKVWDYCALATVYFLWYGISVEGGGEVTINGRTSANKNPYAKIFPEGATLIDKLVIDKAPYYFWSNCIKIKQFNLSFNFQLSKVTSVVITYLYRDYDSNLSHVFSKGYREFKVINGQNDIKIKIGIESQEYNYLDILPCCLVISCYPENLELINEVKSIIKNQFIGKRLFYDEFDLYGTEQKNKTATNWLSQYGGLSQKRIIENHDVANFSHLYFASNNYWKNQTSYVDINPNLKNSNFYPYSFLTKTVQETDARIYRLNTDGSYGNNMPDSVRIQEIHAALEAQKFANNSSQNNARVANIGYYVERIARVLGISVNEDGSIKSIRQAKAITPGSVIPPGWDFGQFGTNAVGIEGGQVGGNAGELRDGIIYEQRSNKLIPDKFRSDQSQIEVGDYVLCENWPQYLNQLFDDLDKALSWQEIGAGGIPAADGSGKVMLYEGMGSVVAEMAYMLSRMSLHTSQGLISSKVTQGICLELLQGLGLPIEEKNLPMYVSAEGKPSLVSYPGIAQDAPTVTTQIGWLLQNVGLVLAGNLVYDETVKKDIK